MFKKVILSLVLCAAMLLNVPMNAMALEMGHSSNEVYDQASAVVSSVENALEDVERGFNYVVEVKNKFEEVGRAIQEFLDGIESFFESVANILPEAPEVEEDSFANAEVPDFSVGEPGVAEPEEVKPAVPEVTESEETIPEETEPEYVLGDGELPPAIRDPEDSDAEVEVTPEATEPEATEPDDKDGAEENDPAEDAEDDSEESEKPKYDLPPNQTPPAIRDNNASTSVNTNNANTNANGKPMLAVPAAPEKAEIEIPEGVIAGTAQTVSEVPDAAEIKAEVEGDLPAHVSIYGWIIKTEAGEQLVLADSFEEMLMKVYNENGGSEIVITPLYQTEKDNGGSSLPENPVPPVGGKDENDSKGDSEESEKPKYNLPPNQTPPAIRG